MITTHSERYCLNHIQNDLSAFSLRIQLQARAFKAADGITAMRDYNKQKLLSIDIDANLVITVVTVSL